MAFECDQASLLAHDENPTVEPPTQPKRKGLQTILIATIAGIAATAVWRHSLAASPSETFAVDGIISDVALLDPDFLEGRGWFQPEKCVEVGTLDTYVEADGLRNRFWAHRFEEVNWHEHCTGDVKKREDCISRLIEKYVGDYFDTVIENIKVKDQDYVWLPYNSQREMDRWKARVIRRMQEQSKGFKRLDHPKHAPLEWAHRHIRTDFTAANPGAEFPETEAVVCEQEGTRCTTNGWICDAMRDERPTSARAVGICQPKYTAWGTFERYFSTYVPRKQLCHDANECQSYENSLSEQQKAEAYKQPGEHDVTNAQLAACKDLLQPLRGEDWISATLTAVDVRECIASGGQKPKNPYSRAWVRNCLPGRREHSHDDIDDEPRLIGWPGYVLEFISEYHIPESDCVRDYDGYLDTKGHCPTTCEDGSSLSGYLRRYSTFKDYKVIHNRITPNGNKYNDLTEEQTEFARYLIWKSGPLIGLVEKTRELVDCTDRDDVVLFGGGCDADAAWTGNDGKHMTDRMSSITVWGWGQHAGTRYWRFVSAFQSRGRMRDCGVKAFVIPEFSQKGIQIDFYDTALNAFRAEAVCNKFDSFCSQEGAGYTETEDCDGDGVLDHWCYVAGKYEAFISSRSDCKVLEKPCRRSVLPGRTFGCQRPLGWCMNGETYKRDADCDGDGHFDHVCEKYGHAGFISSSQDCIDTWEEGTAGRKCEPQPLKGSQDLSVNYKFVLESGECVPHDEGVCFKSHPDWPRTSYKPRSECIIRVEATSHQVPEKDSANCEKETEPETHLLLEVLYDDTERPQFDLNGEFYGDHFSLNEKLILPLEIGQAADCVGTEDCIDWRPLAENIHRVFDNHVLKFTTDSTVEKEGWLVCLRERSKIPPVYNAGCSEIGDDVWAKLYNVREEKKYVTVECEMEKCRKAPVITVGEQPDIFFRTTNLCDAGWSVAKGDRFDVAFSSPRTLDDGPISEPTFTVVTS